MAYTTPTAATFKLRYPEFAAVADATVNMVIAEAEPMVGETWLDRDRLPAVLALTAHKLASSGLGVGGSGSAILGTVKRRKVGDVETEFSGPGGAAGASATGYDSTAYGREFKALQRRNFHGIAVV